VKVLLTLGSERDPEEFTEAILGELRALIDRGGPSGQHWTSRPRVRS
jgi:hypothetical protein